MNKKFLVIVLLLFITATLINGHCADGSEEQSRKHDISHIVQATGVSPSQSALLIVRLEDNTSWSSGADRIEKPFLTGCTIRIPQTLIALETRYADPDTCFQWDGKKRWLPSWNQDQTLETAFQRSTVWVFQQIMRDLGYETIVHWMTRLGYGDCNVGSAEDYWVRGPIKTSAKKQVLFLTQVAQETLLLSPTTFRLGKQIMVEESNDKWTLYSKTGWRSDVEIGWYVGWVEADQKNGLKQTYIFAFNMDINSEEELPLRKAIVRAALDVIGATP